MNSRSDIALTCCGLAPRRGRSGGALPVARAVRDCTHRLEDLSGRQFTARPVQCRYGIPAQGLTFVVLSWNPQPKSCRDACRARLDAAESTPSEKDEILRRATESFELDRRVLRGPGTTLSAAVIAASVYGAFAVVERLEAPGIFSLMAGGLVAVVGATVSGLVFDASQAAVCIVAALAGWLAGIAAYGAVQDVKPGGTSRRPGASSTSSRAPRGWWPVSPWGSR